MGGQEVQNFRGAVASGEAFLNMPRLRLVDVDGNILARALALMRKYQLDPRDSIHAASALTEEQN